jgi:hypothetical protein
MIEEGRVRTQYKAENGADKTVAFYGGRRPVWAQKKETVFLGYGCSLRVPLCKGE